MPQITLSRSQVQSLVAFCDAAGQTEFFIAKDQGAYVGSSTGAEPHQQCLFYFKGCDPTKDENFYENARASFGGDDFGEHLPVSHLRAELADSAVAKVRITVRPTSMSIQGLLAKSSPKPLRA